MKAFYYCFIITISILFCSCSNEYRFFQSCTATLVAVENTPYGWQEKEYNIAVDVYYKEGQDSYMVKNQDGVEYFATRAMIFPSKFSRWDNSAPYGVSGFRYGNHVGTLYLDF